MVLLTATLLSLSSNALWISYSAVADVSTEYFDKTVNEIDLLASISFIVGIPMCLVSSYVVDAVGLRAGMILSSVLTFFGGLIRCLSTFYGINDSLSLVGYCVSPHRGLPQKQASLSSSFRPSSCFLHWLMPSFEQILSANFDSSSRMLSLASVFLLRH